MLTKLNKSRIHPHTFSPGKHGTFLINNFLQQIEKINSPAGFEQDLLFLVGQFELGCDRVEERFTALLKVRIVHRGV